MRLHIVASMLTLAMVSTAAPAQEQFDPMQPPVEQPMPEFPVSPDAPEAPQAPQRPAAPIPDDQSTPKGALKVMANAMQQGDPEQIRQVLLAENELQERMIDGIAEFAEAVAQLRNAAVQAYGQQGAVPLVGDLTEFQHAGMARLEAAEEVIDNDTATVTHAEAPPATLRRVDGQWRVPVGPMAEGQDELQVEQRLREIANQSDAIREVASEIQARQHATADEAAHALQARMMDAARETPAAAREGPEEVRPQPDAPMDAPTDAPMDGMN